MVTIVVVIRMSYNSKLLIYIIYHTVLPGCSSSISESGQHPHKKCYLYVHSVGSRKLRLWHKATYPKVKAGEEQGLDCISLSPLLTSSEPGSPWFSQHGPMATSIASSTPKRVEVENTNFWAPPRCTEPLGVSEEVSDLTVNQWGLDVCRDLRIAQLRSGSHPVLELCLMGRLQSAQLPDDEWECCLAMFSPSSLPFGAVYSFLPH